MTVSSRAQRITLARGAARAGSARRERRRAVLVEIEHDHVRLQACGLDTIRAGSCSWPITSMPSSSSTRRSPIAMIGARSPSRTRVRGLVSTGTASPDDARAADRVDRAACVPIRITSCGGCARASRRSQVDTSPRAPGTSIVASASSPSAVRAITRCGAGLDPVEAEAAVAVGGGPQPGLGHARPTRRRPARPSASRNVPPMRWNSVIVRAGPSEIRVADRLGAHLRPAHERRAGLDRDVDHVVDRGLVLAADRASRSRPSPRAGGRPTSRPRRAARRRRARSRRARRAGRRR